MDPRKPNPDDVELERDLAEIRRHYSVVEGEAPPEMLDQAVLNFARRELKSEENTGASRWSLFFSASRGPRWIGGAVTAAVVVLAFTLFVEQKEMAPAPPPASNMELRRSPARTDQPALQTGQKRKAEMETVDRLEALKSQDKIAKQGEERARESGQTVGGQVLDAGAPTGPAAPLEESVADAETKADTEAAAQVSFGASAEAPAPVSNEAEEDLDESPAVRQLQFEDFRGDRAYRDEPDAWIKAMLQRLQSGETSGLEEEINAFKKRYPERTLPEALASFGDENSP